jgi:hypothetical protein
MSSLIASTTAAVRDSSGCRSRSAGHPLHGLVGGVEHQRLLGGEVVVDGLLRDADPIGDLRDLHVVEAAGGEHGRGGVGDELSRQAALALPQPLVRVARAVPRLLRPPGAAHHLGDLLAHLVGDELVQQLLLGVAEGLGVAVVRRVLAVHVLRSSAGR